MVKNNFIVISGGPGGGKTTLLNALSEKGFQHIGESGRLIIQERLKEGMPPRPAPEEFARQMFRIDLDQFIFNSGRSEILFFDRSFMDSAWLIYQTDKIYFDQIADIIKTNRFYTKVFLTPPWQKIFINDSERDQTFDESIKTYENLRNWYSISGYEMIDLPRLPVEKRAAFILDEIK